MRFPFCHLTIYLSFQVVNPFPLSVDLPSTYLQITVVDILSIILCLSSVHNLCVSLTHQSLGCQLCCQDRIRTCMNFHSREGFPSVFPISPPDYFYFHFIFRYHYLDFLSFIISSISFTSFNPVNRIEKHHTTMKIENPHLHNSNKVPASIIFILS